MEILKTNNEVECFVSDVQNFADQHRTEFGFLTKAAYEELALKGQLWIAKNKENNFISGYLIFGGVYPCIKVFQLFVNPICRKSGVGKKLLDELILYGEENSYRCINAKVAADLPANHFWNKSGFKLTTQRKGGKTTKRIINIRSYQLKTLDLLSGIDLQAETELSYADSPLFVTPTYALDINPIFDITKNRAGSKESLKIISQAMSGLFTLCITPEFRAELERTTFDNNNDPVLQMIKSLPTLPVSNKETINSISEELRKIIFPHRSLSGKKVLNDHSDLSHIAYCIVNKIQGFITRERKLLENNSLLKEKYGISIISPSELFFDNDVGLEEEIITGNANDIIQIRKLNDTAINKAIEFVSYFGKTESEAKALVTRSPGSSAIKKVVISIGDKVVGYSSWNLPSGLNNTIDFHLYVDEESVGVVTAVDHLIESMIRDTLTMTLCKVILSVNPKQSMTIDTARKKGFTLNNENGKWSKVVFNGFINEKNWPSFCLSFRDLTGLNVPRAIPSMTELMNTGVPVKSNTSIYSKCLSLFDFETLISPGFIFAKDRYCLLLPIQEEYAKGLLGNLRDQLELLPSSEVTFLLEKAYFRSATRVDFFKRGDVVAFYVSGKNSVQQIIALARITYTNLMGVDEAMLKFSRQGVLGKSKLDEIANASQGTLHAFTFDNLKILPHRLNFQEAKNKGIISKANLVTVEKVEHPAFSVLLKETYRNE